MQVDLEEVAQWCIDSGQDDTNGGATWRGVWEYLADVHNITHKVNEIIEQKTGRSP